MQYAFVLLTVQLQIILHDMRLILEDFQKNSRIQLLINVIFLILLLHRLLQFLSVEVNIFDHNLDAIINNLVAVSRQLAKSIDLIQLIIITEVFISF